MNYTHLSQNERYQIYSMLELLLLPTLPNTWVVMNRPSGESLCAIAVVVPKDVMRTSKLLDGVVWDGKDPRKSTGRLDAYVVMCQSLLSK